MIEQVSMNKAKTYFSRPTSSTSLTSLWSPSATSSVLRVSKKICFSLGARVRETGELFTVPDCHCNMKIRELKSALELVVGIPADFQRLCYLDQGDLMEESTLHHHDIIPGTAVTVGVWPYNGWVELVSAAAAGDLPKLKQVMSRPAPPNSSASSWLHHRLFSALFIAVHRGHTPAILFLLQQGADVRGQTPHGRGPLHAAAAQGLVQIIQELLLAGAPLSTEDGEGMTALSLAAARGQERSARQLFLSHWQERTAGIRIKPRLDEEELFAHQRYGSHLKTWRCGSHARRYMAHIGGEGRGEGCGGVGGEWSGRGEGGEGGEGKVSKMKGKGDGGGDRRGRMSLRGVEASEGKEVRGKGREGKGEGRERRGEGREVMGQSRSEERWDRVDVTLLEPAQSSTTRLAKRAWM